ncbi:MAG: hypothetical protein FWB74_07415 [Defluviitaleaceae bacterium]|nr:hypothetical protein [Defluviitaleaceae bacterium]
MKKLLTLLILLFLSGCAANRPSLEAYTDSPLMPYFRELFPEHQLFAVLEGDYTNIGMDCLVVVFRYEPNYNRKVTVIYNQGEITVTEPIPAPYEDVTMRWHSINRDGDYDLVLSGRRGIHMGLGVLRFTDGVWHDLFGGLEDCC